MVIPYRCDELDMQHLKVMGDLGQVSSFFFPFTLSMSHILLLWVPQGSCILSLCV